jgi:hypothetical protein
VQVRTNALLAASLLAACSKNGGGAADESLPNNVPPTVIAHGRCDAPQTMPSSFPGGVFNQQDTVTCKFAHEGCAVGQRQEICQKGKSLAFPDCAPTAEVAGTVIMEPGANPESESSPSASVGDGDFTFNIEPIAQAAILDPAATPPALLPRELRDQATFSKMDGGIHIEVQSCRFCRGPWIFPEMPNMPFSGNIIEGDSAAASGNWVADMPQHEGWSEIHEATAIANVRAIPDGSGISYILVNAFFVDSPDQRNDLLLDVLVPMPANTARVVAPHLHCDVDPPVIQRGCPCPTLPGVAVTAEPNDTGACRIRIHRGAGAPPPLPFNCTDTPPCFGGPFTPSPATCANVFYGGAIRASWQ